MSFRFLVAALAMLAGTSVTILSADTVRWPEFRGPLGNGYAPDSSPPVSIDSSKVRWQIPIHGKGWSSPVVWGDQVWLTTATEDGTTMSVLCVDRHSGKVLRDIVLLENENPDFCHPTNSYASPTPAIEEGRLYVHFGRYLTACLDTATAEILWERRDLECDHYRGPASSPILYDGKLYVAFDGYDVQYVIALDTATGDTVWKRERDIDYGTDNGDRMKAYCTGHILTVDGQPQLVYPSAVATIAYDPENGEPIWTVYHDGMNASARPVHDEGLVFITNGMGSMVAVSPDGSGDVTGSHIEWSDRKAVAKKSSQTIVDGLLYMLSDDGIISCRDAKTGKIHWLERAFRESAASPIYAGGYLYFFGGKGEIITITPGKEYTPVAETELGDGFLASPAVAGNTMILRSKTHLYCVSD